MQDKFDLVCVGTALVDSIIKGFDPTPVSASGYRAKSSALSAGGEAVNVSIAAAKLGLRAKILCALGEDCAGAIVEDALSRFGVDTGAVVRGEAPTPVTTMFVNADGTRKSITNEAHRHNFHPERKSARFTDARAIAVGSLFRAPFDDAEIILSVLKTAKAHGMRTFADTKLPNFRALTLADIRKAMPYIDFITPNEDEARHFSGKTDPAEMARVFLSYGAKNVVVKLGAKGCYYLGEAGQYRLPAFQVDAVDATGAGDNFLAGLVCELLRGAEVPDALRFASACGAICMSAVGASSALQSRAQVLEFLEKAKL